MVSYRIDVELPLFLALFKQFFTSSVGENLLIYRTCYIVLGYNKSDCGGLGNVGNTTLEKLVQPTSNNIISVLNTTETVFMILIGLVVGTWSDKFGRKPVLVLSFLGLFLSSTLEALYSYFEISPWYYLICTFPRLMVGGYYAFQTVAFSYLVDTTTEETRSIRMALLEGISIVGVLTSTPSATFLFKATNYTVVYSVAAVLVFIGLLWNIFVIKESIKMPERKGRIRGFFNFSTLKEIGTTSFKKRSKHKRSLILLIAAAGAINTFVMDGHLTLAFPFLRAKLNWVLTKYTYYSMANSGFMVVSSVGGTLVLTKLFRLSEILAVLIAILALGIGSLCLAVATEDWEIFATSILRSLFGIVNPLTTSFISKLVETNEIGTLISFMSVVKCSCSLVAVPLYNAFYNLTLNEDPAYFNYFSGGMMAVAAFIMVIAHLLVIKYKPLEQDSKQHQEQAKAILKRSLPLCDVY